MDRWPNDSRSFEEVISDVTITIKCKPCLDWEFFNYSEKYKRAAYEITSDTLETSDIRKLDLYFFPIAFLYRHSVELLLKAIIFKHEKDNLKQAFILKETHHNLSLIFDKVKLYIPSNLLPCDSIVSWIDNLLISISYADKESDSFRYPFSIRTDNFYSEKTYYIEPLFTEQTHINLVNFANKMEQLLDYLEYIYNEKNMSDLSAPEYSPVFLETGGSYYNQSVVGYNYSHAKYYPFVSSYIETAEYLYSLIIGGDKDIQNLLFLPMCYLYRNGIELSLKQILFEESNFDFQKSIEGIVKRKHSILGLWKLIRDEIKKNADSEDEYATLETVEMYINQLHVFDGNATRFRYPCDKHLALHFKKSKKMDIFNVNNFFIELSTFLSAVDSMMNNQNEIMRDLEAEYLSDMQSYYNYD